MPGENEVWSIVLELLAGRPGRTIAQAAVLTAVVGGTVAFAAVNKTVTLSVDGQERQVRAFAGTVDGLLDDEGIAVTQRDIVAPAPSSDLKDGATVVVRYARPLTVTIDGKRVTYWTTERSVENALRALGIRADGARLSASRSQPIGRDGLALSLSTPKTVTLAADGRTRALTSSALTVADLLTEQRIALGRLDQLSVARSTPLVDGLVVAVTRIVHKRVKVTEDVAFGTQESRDGTLFKGDEKVVTPGKKGSRTAVYELVLANGKVTSRKLVGATTVTAPVDEVVKVGTKAKPSTGGNVGGDVDSLNWPALAKCESGGNPNAVNPAGYYGLYQFSVSTWHSVGGSGKPTDYGEGEQTYRAKLLYKKAGAGQWPNCGPKLFT